MRDFEEPKQRGKGGHSDGRKSELKSPHKPLLSRKRFGLLHCKQTPVSSTSYINRPGKGIKYGKEKINLPVLLQNHQSRE